MLTELPPGRREVLRPLFAGFPGLHGLVDAALAGGMGSVWADDAARPAVAHVDLDFDLLVGDPSAPTAEGAVRALERASVIAAPSWEPLLRRVWGDALGTRTRVDFQPGVWDRARLRGFIDALPPGFVLKRITIDDAARFAELADSLVYNFSSLEDYVARGVGFGIEYEGRFVSGCSSFTISPRRLEIDIQTHPDFRQRDLATATASAMIAHCIDSGLEPCWDAQNEMSAALATKLGFVQPSPYTAYEVRPTGGA